MCECVCYCAYFYYVNKLYVHVCVLEKAKHSCFALPNPLSCCVTNKICLNQRYMKINIKSSHLDSNLMKQLSFGLAYHWELVVACSPLCQ